MDLIVEHCPRCLARGGRVSDLHLSEQPNLLSPLQVGQPPEPELDSSSPGPGAEEDREMDVREPEVGEAEIGRAVIEAPEPAV